MVIALRLLTMRRLHASGGARWTTVWRWSGLTLAVLLILIAAARPGIEHGERGGRRGNASAENTNVFFVVDRSPDTAVEDYGDRQSRMSGIRSDIDTLIDRYPQARFAMIAFASRAVIWTGRCPRTRGASSQRSPPCALRRGRPTEDR